MAAIEARPTMIALPTIALAMPLPGMPLGRCELTKNSRLVTAGSPLAIVNQSTRPSGTRASTVRAYMASIAKLLLNRRMRLCLIRGFSYSCPCLGGVDEEQRKDVDRQRDQDEDETDLNQRALVHVPGRLDELVGDDRGQRVARRKDRMGDLGPVADDHGHGDGLSKRASQREDRGAEDPGAGRRQDHVPDRLPPGGAERDGRLAQTSWHSADHVP